MMAAERQKKSFTFNATETKTMMIHSNAKAREEKRKLTGRKIEEKKRRNDKMASFCFKTTFITSWSARRLIRNAAAMEMYGKTVKLKTLRIAAMLALPLRRFIRRTEQ